MEEDEDLRLDEDVVDVEYWKKKALLFKQNYENERSSYFNFEKALDDQENMITALKNVLEGSNINIPTSLIKPPVTKPSRRGLLKPMDTLKEDTVRARSYSISISQDFMNNSDNDIGTVFDPQIQSISLLDLEDPVVLSTGELSLIFEDEVKKYDITTYCISTIPDIYSEKFIKEKHFNFILYIRERDEYFFISILEEPLDGYFLCLRNNKKGFKEFTISVNDVFGSTKSSKSVGARLTKYLSTMPDYSKNLIYRIKDPLLNIDIQSVERKHRQTKETGFRLAIIYCKTGQKKIL